MSRCFFVSDLHGDETRYAKLFDAIQRERPAGVFVGGDLLPPMGLRPTAGLGWQPDFVGGFLAAGFLDLRKRLAPNQPEVFLIPGNDDPRCEEAALLEAATRDAWHYMHPRSIGFRGHTVFGYAFVPPTPFLLKDWERYDVSRYMDPGCVSPEEGRRTVPVSEREARYSTIAQDLDLLVGEAPIEKAVFLLHAPPYQTPLDRAALDGKFVDHVPLDVHVGSIAIRRFIEARQPLLTLHGHVHESARLTGEWKTTLGRTVCLNAAHDGPELSLIRFTLKSPGDASRELL